jgi:hypothetical protein
VVLLLLWLVAAVAACWGSGSFVIVVVVTRCVHSLLQVDSLVGRQVVSPFEDGKEMVMGTTKQRGSRGRLN